MAQWLALKGPGGMQLGRAHPAHGHLNLKQGDSISSPCGLSRSRSWATASSSGSTPKALVPRGNSRAHSAGGKTEAQGSWVTGHLHTGAAVKPGFSAHLSNPKAHPFPRSLCLQRGRQADGVSGTAGLVLALLRIPSASTPSAQGRGASQCTPRQLPWSLWVPQMHSPEGSRAGQGSRLHNQLLEDTEPLSTFRAPGHSESSEAHRWPKANAAE